RHTRYSRDWSSDVCSSDLAYFRYACDLGDVHGCEVLATWLALAGNDDDSARYWTRGKDLRARACEAGTNEDCIVLGAYYVRGLRSEERRVGKNYTQSWCGR